MKVLIVDDHAVLRRGLREILEEEYPLAEFWEASTAEQAVALASQNPLDIVILDLSLPGRSGMEVLRFLQKEYPKTKILVLSMHSEDQYAVRVLRAGAAGYLSKESAPEELIQAVRKVMRGGRHISPNVAERLVLEQSGAPDVPAHELLTNREYEVLVLLGNGKTVSEVAKKLSLSVKTISSHRTRILQKMNMRNNAQLMQYTVACKLDA